MPEPKKRASKKKASLQSSLIEPLKHCMLATHHKHEDGLPHVVALFGGWAVASDGVLAAGHPIVDNITASPEIEPLLKALTASTVQVAVSVNGPRLHLVAGDSVWWINCREDANTGKATADPAQIAAGASLRDGLAVCGRLLSDKPTKLLEAAALTVAGGSAIGTDYATIIQARTGVELPAGRFIPKAFIVALAKCSEPASVGWTDNSITVHFVNGAWLQTMCYRDVDVPDVAALVLEQEFTSAQPCIAIPPTLIDVSKRLKPFAANGTLYFDDNALRVIAANEENAAIEPCSGVPGGYALKLDGLASIADVERWGIGSTGRALIAYGGAWRAALRLEVYRPLIAVSAEAE